MSFLGFLLFGADTKSNILENLSQDDTVVTLLRLIMSLNLCCSFAIVFFTCRFVKEGRESGKEEERKEILHYSQ